MANTADIGGDALLFVGEDKTFSFEVLDATGIPVDLNAIGAVGVFDVRLKDNSPDPAIFSKAMSIVGAYNAARDLNTQRWQCFLSNVELNTVKAKTYRYSCKVERVPETVIARGNFIVEKATAP
jgi:hypothetical protein